MVCCGTLIMLPIDGRLITEAEYVDYVGMMNQARLYEMDGKGNFFT